MTDHGTDHAPRNRPTEHDPITPTTKPVSPQVSTDHGTEPTDHAPSDHGSTPLFRGGDPGRATPEHHDNPTGDTMTSSHSTVRSREAVTGPGRGSPPGLDPVAPGTSWRQVGGAR